MSPARTSANRSDDSAWESPPRRLPTAERTASTMTTSDMSVTSDTGRPRDDTRHAAMHEQFGRALGQLLDSPGLLAVGQGGLALDRRLQIEFAAVAGEDFGRDVRGARAGQPGDHRTDVLGRAVVELP